MIHPFGVGLILCSAVLAVLLSSVPHLAEWSGRAPWVLLTGVVGYLASVAVVSVWPPNPSPQSSVSMPSGSAAPSHLSTSEAPVLGHLPASIEPRPPDFVDLTRRALRALNKPATLTKSGLIELLPLSLDEVWQQSGKGDSGDRSPLEQSQALRAVLLRGIEQLNVADEGSAQAHQYEVLRRQYVMGQNVAQVAMRLSIAEPGVYRRSAEGVDAVAVDLWRHEQLLAAQGR